MQLNSTLYLNSYADFLSEHSNTSIKAEVSFSVCFLLRRGGGVEHGGRTDPFSKVANWQSYDSECHNIWFTLFFLFKLFSELLCPLGEKCILLSQDNMRPCCFCWFASCFHFLLLLSTCVTSVPDVSRLLRGNNRVLKTHKVHFRKFVSHKTCLDFLSLADHHHISAHCKYQILFLN